MNRTLLAGLVAVALCVGAEPRRQAPREAVVPLAAPAVPSPRFVGAGVLRAHDFASHGVPIDVDSECTFLLVATGGDFTLEARSPSGHTWNSRSDEPGGQGGHTEEFNEFMPGPMELLHIDHPETGTWTLKVIAGAFPDTVEHAGYQLTLLQDTGGRGPQLRVLLADSTRHRGDPIDVRVSLLEDGRPVPGARVQAAVGPDDGPNQVLQLLDDGRMPDVKAGDGIYSGRVARLDGRGFASAEIGATRRGVKGLPDFDREAKVNFQISESRSRLTGKIRDFPRDADGDGLNEEIVFAVGVFVTDATSLKVMGTVRDSEGREVWSGGKDARLEPGTRELELACDTEGLATTNAPGPLVLDSLRLFETETYADLDMSVPHYRTRPYSKGELMHDAIRLEGSGRAHGVDLDHDGRFDVLEAELPIDIRYPGNYLCAGLLENEGKRLLQANVRQDFVEGRNTMRLRFPGSCVASANAKADYSFSGIYVGYYKEPGDTKPSPRYGYTAWEVKLPGGPPPNRFESTPPEQLSGDASYDCR
jgi:hypothetical protein